MTHTVWTHQDFESMSWHDNHVHALRIVAGEHGSGELQLDLDYIAEWLLCARNSAQFRIVPATLRFLGVIDLRINLDYAAASAALGPFSLHAIERRIESRPGHDAQIWTLLINWPTGEITFEASGYEQRATGPAVITSSQHLQPNERPADDD